MSIQKAIYTTLTVTGITLVTSCDTGAPLKKAADVAPIFSDATQLDLGGKFRETCMVLNSRKSAPNLTNIDAGPACASEVGTKAVNMNQVGDNVPFFSLVGEGDGFRSVQEAQNQTFKIKTRAQLWLNLDALAFAQNAISSMDKGAENLLGGPGTDQGSFKMEVLDKGELDPETGYLEMTARFQADGADQGMDIKIDNTIKISTILYDNRYVLIAVETIKDQNFETSLIKSFKIVTVLIPHAQDVYMDVLSEFTFHSFGADSAVKQFFGNTYGDTIKSLPAIFRGTNLRLRDHLKGEK